MANTILTESLNAILRTKRHLFVSPLEWTEEHSKLFRVEWNNDGGSSSSSSRTYGPSDIQPHQTIMVELPEMPPTDFIQRIKILGRNRPPGDKYAAMHGLLLPTRDDVSNSYRWQAQCKRTIRCISSFPNRGLQLVFGKGTRSPVKKSLPCGSLYSVSDSSHTQIFAYIDVADINEARWKEKIKQKRRHYRRPQINKPQTPANARDPCIIGVLLAMAQDRAQEQWASNKSQFLVRFIPRPYLLSSYFLDVRLICRCSFRPKCSLPTAVRIATCTLPPSRVHCFNPFIDPTSNPWCSQHPTPIPSH